MGFSLGDVASQADQMQVFQYLIPFALAFAIVKGILSSTGIFDGNEQVENLIAIAIGFFVGFSDAGSNFYVFMQQSTPGLAVSLLGILGIMMLAGLVFGKSAFEGNIGKYAFGALVVLAAFGVMSGTEFSNIVFQGGSLEDLFVELENAAGLIVIAGILGLVGWAMKPSGGSP